MKLPALILGLLLPWFAEAQQQYYGTRVSSIQLAGADSEQDLERLPLQADAILTAANLRASIQALYDTKHYSYVEADADPAADGTTAITFRVRPVFFFSTIRLEPDDILDRSLSDYLRLPYGEPFSSSTLDRMVQDATDLLRSQGYFQAKITTDTQTNEQFRLVTVTLKAAVGTKAKLGRIQIQGGEQTFTAEELSDALGLDAGDDFSAPKLDKGVAALRAKFTSLRFLNTRVAAERRYNADANTVDLDVRIQPGQFALVQTRGFDISSKKLRDLVPIYEEAAVDPDLIEEGRVHITQYLQQQGYFDAMVAADVIEVDPSLGNAIQINYNVEPGPKHEVLDLRVEGNHYFTSEEIRRTISNRRADPLSRGVFSAETLQQDHDAIEAMYRNAGFEDAAIAITPQDVDHTITVTVHIEEGAQLRIEAIDMIGNSRISTEELLDAVELRAGSLYTPAAIDEARAALTQFYYSRGYADARVERLLDRVPSGGGLRVTFQITEGESYLVGSILVAGNTLTKDKIIRRYSGLQEYKPFNPESILEAQQRLYAMGLFSRVEILTLDQGIPGVRNVLIQVEDAKPILLTYGVGYQEFEHMRGTFEISHNNLFGLNRSLSFRARGSSRERLGQGTYHEPRLFNHELDGFASSFIEHTERPFFSADRLDFSLQVLKRFSAVNNFLLSSSFQTVNIGDIRINPHAQKTDESQLGPCQVCQIGRIGASVIRDRRNDPVNPAVGYFSTTTLQVASGLFGSELNFTSLFNQSSFYSPVGQGTLATSFRFGWNHPFGRTVEYAPGQTQQLPATERYFAGGSTTLRGFGLDEARPQSDPNLEGGNVMTIGNVEYRIPLKRAPISGLGAALFYDTGNVFARLSDVRFAEFTHSAGVGFRYQTPVGPARLDFGFNLRPGKRPDGTPEPRMKIFFTLGNPF